ncbi:MAG: PTS sugar transporter subunit IIA [Zavarzinella sp.]
MQEFLIREAIVPELEATTKSGVIRELVVKLQEAGCFAANQIDHVIAELHAREQLSSTGIGRGVAIPHTRFEEVSSLVGTIGISRAGIPFDSIDDEPVHFVFLLISQPDFPGPHLKALELIVRTTESDEFLAQLLAAHTREEIWNVILSTPEPWE